MTIEKVFPQHNLRVVNLAGVIYEKVDVNLVNDLFNFELLHSKRITKDIRKLFYHHIAVALCDQFTSSLFSEKCVIYFNEKELIGLELHKCLPQAIEEILRTVKHISKTFPIKIHQDRFTFYKAMEHIEQRTGEGIELTIKLKELVLKGNDDYTFAEIVKHTLNDELNELHRRLTSPSRHRLMLA